MFFIDSDNPVKKSDLKQLSENLHFLEKIYKQLKVLAIILLITDVTLVGVVTYLLTNK